VPSLNRAQVCRRRCSYAGVELLQHRQAQLLDGLVVDRVREFGYVAEGHRSLGNWVLGLLSAAAPHDAITIAATTNGTPWTESGFNSTFIKAIRRLEREGAVQPGLTFHGLRHTVGTLLVEAGFDIDTVRRWLGQKTLAMAIHYSETADTTDRMDGVMARFDPLGSKTRT
jgi:hypothetical protein